MTRAAKITYSLALLLGLCAGMLFGFWHTGSDLRSYYLLRRLTAPMVLDDFARTEYRKADADHAKTALLDYAGLLETLQKASPERGEQMRLANTYTRLALLEDAANDAPASRDYMMKARYWYKAAGTSHENYSDSEIKAAQKEVDQRLQQIDLQ